MKSNPPIRNRPTSSSTTDGGAFIESTMSTELVVAFCNSKSGGHQGPRVISGLQQHLGPEGVFDLSKQAPETTIHELCHGEHRKEGAGTKLAPEEFVRLLRIIVCGGDGTCGWVFTGIDRACEQDAEVRKVRDRICICTMPLGTGNDLSRSLGWGKGFSNAMLRAKWIQRVRRASIAQLDRWQISISPTSGEVSTEIPPAFSVVQHDLPAEGTAIHRESTVLERGRTFSISMDVSKSRWSEDEVSYEAIFTNYFSFGLDADIAHEFHRTREEHPEWFSSQLKNKAMYGRYGMLAGGACPCVRSPPPVLNASMPMFLCRKPGEQDWQQVQLPRGTRAVIVLNLQSYAGGQNLWGGCDKSIGFGDGLLEVVAVRSIWDMARAIVMSKLGGGAVRVGKVAELKIGLTNEVTMQIDGEPWRQPESSVHIRPFSVAKVLRASSRSGCCGGRADSADAVLSREQEQQEDTIPNLTSI